MSTVTKAMARMTGRHRVRNAERATHKGGTPQAVKRGVGLFALLHLVALVFVSLMPRQQAPPPGGEGQQQGQGSGQGEGQQQQQQGQGQGQQQQPPPVTFTPEQQAHIDRIAASARTEGKRAGMTEAQASAAADAARKDAEALEAQQKYEPLYKTEQAARATDRQQFERVLRSQAIEAAATRLGFHNPAIAANLLPADAVTVGADFAVSGVTEAMQALVTANPYLVKDPPGQGQQGQGQGSGSGQTRPIPGTPQAQGQGQQQNGSNGQTAEQREAIDRAKADLRKTGRY